MLVNPLSANITTWSNTPKQFVSNLPTNCLSVFGHFVGLALIGLRDLTINLKFATSFGDFENVKLLILSVTQFVT